MDSINSRVGRRDALKIGGLTVGLAAFAAACGDAAGSEDPGRVGYAPAVTDPPAYAIDDIVVLRTASSVELTAVDVYTRLLATGYLGADLTRLVDQIIENHQRIADEMAELTIAAGGEPWLCTNPWLMERTIDPVFELIETSDEPARDAFNTAASIENLTVATNQTFSTQLTDEDASIAALHAATLEARQAAALIATVLGEDGYISPAISGGDTPLDDFGVPLQFSITSRFGSTGQFPLVVGAPDENGVRRTFMLQTPAENSYVYVELEPTC